MVGAALAFGTAYGMTAQMPFIPSAYAADAYGTGDSTGGTNTGNPTNNSGDAADGLELKIDGSTVITAITDKAYGGKAENNEAANNSVTVSGTGTAGRIEGGHSQATTAADADKANATGNAVTIVSGASGNIGNAGNAVAIIGGYAKDDGTNHISGNATENVVKIEGGGNITGVVEGGRSIGGNANENKVQVNAGVLKGDGNVNGPNAVIGGHSQYGNVDKNAVNIGGGTLTGDVMGGAADAAAGQATNNQVTVSNGTITGRVDGGRAVGEANNNAVVISGGSITGTAGGGATNAVSGGNGNAGAQGNSVTISGGNIDGNIYGAFSENGNAGAEGAGNSVTISGGTFGGSVTEVAGGHAKAGDAVYNSVDVTLAGDASLGSVLGGVAVATGQAADHNTVTIGDSAHVLTADVEGGRSHDGGASYNTVTIGGEITGTVTGGNATTSTSANAIGNRVTINKDVSGKVMGGFVSGGAGEASNNIVDINADVGDDVRGGSSSGGTAAGNSVTVNAKVDGAAGVTGGYTGTGVASGNTVIIGTGAVVAESAAGGYATGTGGSATGNTLTINGGQINGTGIGKGAVGGAAVDGNADGNRLNINGGSIAGYAAAGMAGTSGHATGNTLTMTDGSVGGNAQGGYAAGSGDASGNTFTMSGGTVTHNAYGGISASGKAEGNTLEISGTAIITHNAIGGESQNAANNNTVKITGGTIDKNVYGGFGHKNGTATTAEGNQIFISGNPTFSDVNTDIVAARVSTTTGYSNLTDNGNNISFGTGDALTAKVNVNAIAADTIAVNSLGGAALNAGSAAITAKDVNAATIDVSKLALDRVVGEDFTILEGTDNLTVTTVNDGTVTMGTTLQQDVGKNGNKIGFKAGTRRVQGQTTHAVLNAQAGIAALASGNTLIDRAVSGLDAFGAAEDPREWRAFMYTGGGRAEYDTGSSVTNHTWSGIVGIGRHDTRKDGGALNYGLFYEYGRGNYTTDDSAGRGDGNAHYMGGGLLARNETANGFYYEGSFRAGRMTNDARNILHDPATGRAYGYNENSDYWGFHLGVGKILKYTNDRSLDLYGKYYFNHVDGISFNAGGHYDLDAVRTSLIRLGARYNFWKDSGWTSYGGLAYEYEMDGEAGGTADGFAIRTADLGGSSAMFELGLKMQPDKSPWGVDLNLMLHAGQRKGVMGGATVSYSF